MDILRIVLPYLGSASILHFMDAVEALGHPRT